MNLLVLNGSPNRDQGNTHKFLQPFVAEAQKLGAEVETHYVADLNVQPCRGCYTCWKTRGDCVIEDDMRWLLPKIGAADVLVLGVPLYVFHMPAPMKAVIDRILPLASPQIEVVDGQCRHLAREGCEGAMIGSILLVSVCGFWEVEHFDVLAAWTETLCRTSDARFAGKLLRPHAYAYAAMPGIVPAKSKVVHALRQAARELIQEGRVSADSEAAVATPLMSQEAYLKAANKSW
jgi:hypothetical protein